MKKEYTTPVIEIITLENEDIVTSSTFDPTGMFGQDADSWYQN